MDRETTAQKVTDSLVAFEQALDHALALGADTVAEITRARGQLGFGIKIGATAISKLVASTEGLAIARERVSEAHDDLAVVQRRFGLRPNMVGGGEKGPNDETLPRASLRQVA